MEKSNNWNFIDNILSLLRTSKIRKYIEPNSTFCDIGCGNGRFLIEMAPYLKKGIGLDRECYIDKKVLGDHNNLEFCQLNLDKAQSALQDGLAENVGLIAVLEHLEEPEKVLKEAYRILKKGGTLVLTTPSPASKPILEFLAFKLRIISESEIRDHKNYFSKKDIKQVLMAAGFKENDIEVSSFQLGLNNFCVAKKE